MRTSDSNANISHSGIQSVFTQLDDPSRPVTAVDVSNELECSQEHAYQNLMELVEQEVLHTRDVNETTRVWWRPAESKSFDQQGDQEEFNTFVDTVEDYAIFMLDTDGTVVSWNEGAERIKGYKEDEIIGNHFSTFYTDTDIDDGVPKQNLETAATKGRVEDTGWRVRKDGSQFWANVTITALYDDDGSLQGFTKVTRDMTEQREYEQRLREERDLTKQIVETVPVGIFVVTTDGEFVRANRQLLNWLDNKESALPNYDITAWEIYDANDEPIPFEEWPWMQVTETGEPVTNYQCQADIPNIGNRWLSVNAAPIESQRHDAKRIVISINDITNQKKREKELKRESEQTEKLLRTAPIAIAVQNNEGETVLANHRAQEVLGLSEKEFAKATGDTNEWSLYDADGNPLSSSELPSARAIATEEPVQNEDLIIEPPNNDRLRLQVNATPLFDSNGSVERVIVAGKDITGLKDRERQLKQQKMELETELGEIVGRITDAFYALDENWRFTHVNEQAEELLDFQDQGLVGECVWEVFDWVADTWFRDEYEQAMEAQESTSFEFYYPDPLNAWLEIHAYPSETGLSVYFRDITERKERERKLEESKRRYRTLIDHFPNGAVALVDKDVRYQTIGGTPFDMTDITAESVSGKLVEDVLSPQLADELVPRYEAALEGESNEFVVELGNQVYQFQIIPVRDESGDIFAALGMSQDITERRRYEQQLEESNERLEQFAYAVSHDLQEPLRMVTSFLQLIEQRYGETLDAEGREFIEYAVDGAERMREMINGLLEYSRVETQGNPFEPVDLETILSNVRDDLQIQIEESNAEITAESLPQVEGDSSQIRQVFQNFLENAIEYSGDEPPKVRITAERMSSSWKISVHDNGIGIDPENQERIFEVFQRLHDQEEHPGTGIGLSICQRIIERHGGSIQVESSPGDGTTFSFTLPISPHVS